MILDILNKVQKGNKTMPYLYVKQKVADFDKWYSVFKSNEKAQQEAGFTELQLLRDVADPNIIVLLRMF